MNPHPSDVFYFFSTILESLATNIRLIWLKLTES